MPIWQSGLSRSTYPFPQRYSPDDSHYRLGPVHTCLYIGVHKTGDWDLFPWNGPLEWARAETGGAD